MQKVVCPYCGRVAKYVDSSVIYYGHSYGMAYLCRPCNAYVGVHSGTDRPKGSLANAELRGWRKATHARFDPLWRDGPFKKRNAAYRWLSEQMKLPIEQTHIGMFTVEQCKAALEIINKGVTVFTASRSMNTVMAAFPVRALCGVQTRYRAGCERLRPNPATGTL